MRAAATPFPRRRGARIVDACRFRAALEAARPLSPDEEPDPPMGCGGCLLFCLGLLASAMVLAAVLAGLMYSLAWGVR